VVGKSAPVEHLSKLAFDVKYGVMAVCNVPWPSLSP